MSMPAQADDAAVRAAAAKRAASFTPGSQPLPTAITGTSPSRGVTNFGSGFLYFPGATPGVNVGGRVPVGKSHVYVPYYGNVSGDPAHPNVQGTTGIAYGFRTWDISVLNNGSTASQQSLPGVDTPKTNPALSLSIRF
jgi:hypothetical protein